MNDPTPNETDDTACVDDTVREHELVGALEEPQYEDIDMDT